MKQNRGNRKPGPRIKRTSRAERQTAIWAAIRDIRGDWTTPDIAETSGAPRSTETWETRTAREQK